MSYSLSGSTVTQSGTDTSYAGLNGLAGVTRLTLGDGFLYVMPTLNLIITGSITIADPSKDSFICNQLLINSGGSLTSGAFATDGVTPLTTGSHFVTLLQSGQVSDTVGSGSLDTKDGSSLTLRGGSFELSGSWRISQTATIRLYGVSIFASKTYSAESTRIRAYGTDVIIRNGSHYDIAYDLFRIPSEFSAKGYGAEYVAQYVGSSFGGADAKFTASALSNADGTSDFDNYGNGWVELYNCAKGASLLVTIVPSSPSPANHCVPLFQDINFTVKNLSGTVQNNARFRCVDAPVSNSPTTTITTRSSLKTWDFRNPITYSGTTNSSGLVSASPCLQVWHGASNLKNLRFPSSTATFRFCAYSLKQQDFNIVLGSDSAIAFLAAMTAVPFLPLSESSAAALTGIALSASGANSGTITLTTSRTVSEVWQYWRQWIATFANFSSNDTWDYDGVILDLGAWNITINGCTLTGNITTSSTLTLNATGLLASTASQFKAASAIVVDSDQNFQGSTFTAGSYTGTWTVVTATDIITTGTSNTLITGSRVRLTTTGALPALTTGTLDSVTDYYAISLSTTTLRLATTKANALAGTAIDFSGTGSGTHTITEQGAQITTSGTAAVYVDTAQLANVTGGAGVTISAAPTSIEVSAIGAPVDSAIGVFRRSAPLIADRAQFTLASGNNSGNGTLVISATIPLDTPAAGFVRVVRSSGAEDRLAFTSYTGATFTLSGTLPTTYTAGDGCYVGYLDVLGSATGSESNTIQYVADRDCVLVVRKGSGAGRIQDVRQNFTITNTAQILPVSGILDSINNATS